MLPGAEDPRSRAAHRKSRADVAAVIADRGPDSSHPEDDVLVGDRDATFTRLVQRGEERSLARRRVLRPRRKPVGARCVRLPLLARLGGEERPWPSADVERKRAAEPKRHRLHPEPVDAFDAHRLVSVADAEEDRLAGLVVDALHDRKRGLPNVEAGCDRAAEAQERDPEPIRSASRPGRDVVERLHARQEPIHGGPRLVDELRETCGADLAFLGQPVEDERNLAQDVDGGAALGGGHRYRPMNIVSTMRYSRASYMTVVRVPAEETDRSELARLYLEMLRIRLFEDAVLRQFMANTIDGTTHLCQGQEAVSVGVCAALEPGDAVAATYRGHGAALALGVDPTRLMAELLGRASGTNGGRGGSMNVTDVERGLIGCFGIVGGSIAAATGAALAAQLLGDRSVAVAFFGDGAVNQAYFHECLNWAVVRRLPVVYVCENNLYGEWTPMAAVTAGSDITRRAAAYDIPAAKVDGNDVLAVRAAAEEAVSRARSGAGPAFLECLTYRHKGHSKVDPGAYRPKDEVEEWLARDPIPRLAAALDDDTVESAHEEAEAELQRVLEAAAAAPYPSVTARATSTKVGP